MGDFDRFKSAYPRRQGSNPWKPAEQKFNSLVKAGVEPEKIILAAQQFAREEAKNVGTAFIPMARTWLNQWRFADVELTPEKPAMDWDKIVSFYKRTGIWSKWAGADPESRASPTHRFVVD